jgi:hypothetical protein
MALVGVVGVYVILAGTMASQVPALRRASTADIVDFVVALLGSAAIIVVVHRAMRGTFGATGAAPLEALAALERRHAGRLRLMRFMPWVFACLVAASVPRAFLWEGYTAQQIELLVAAVVFVLGVMAFQWPRLRRRIARDLREVAEARRLLGEVGDEGSEGKEKGAGHTA